MLSPLRLWAAGIAITLCACGDDSSTSAPPPSEPEIPPVTPPPPQAAPKPNLEDLEFAVQDAAEIHLASPTQDNLWEWIWALSDLGWGLTEWDREVEAGAPYQLAHDLLPPCPDPDDLSSIAFIHDGLGRSLQRHGEWVLAELHLRRGLAIRAKADWDSALLERGHSEQHLGMLLLTQGRYAEAGRLLHSALQHTPEQAPWARASRHDCLGRYYLALRAYKSATLQFEKAITLGEKGVAQTDAFLVELQSNLALCRLRSGAPIDALNILQGLLDKENLVSTETLADLLNLSGTVFSQLDRADEAERDLRAALRLVRESVQGDHPAIASQLANLGSILVTNGKYGEAIDHLTEARDLLEGSAVSEHHQLLVEILYQLADCHRIQKSPIASQAASAARDRAGELLATLLQHGSERELLTFRHQVDLHSVLCRLEISELIANSLLNGKDLIMQSVLNRRSKASSEKDKLQASLDALVLQGKLLDEARLSLEQKIQNHPPTSFYSIRWQDVQAKLSPHQVLVDCVRYRPDSQSPKTSYGAIVLLPEGPPRWIPLAPHSALSTLHLLRQSIASRAEGLRTGGKSSHLSMKGLLSLLHRKFWAPIAEVFPEETTEVLLSPAGDLHLVPYALLRSPKGFLCQTLPSLKLVSSGRSLLVEKDSPRHSSWTILGVSDFAAHREERAHPHQIIPWQKALLGLADLPSVAQELSQLSALAPPESQRLSDGEATEKALQTLDAPRVLHLASHGAQISLEGGTDFTADPALLYEQAIVLHPDAQSDGLLFPEEAATMNLIGTELVVLSTCRSALGRPVFGEGLLGMQRGFRKAGAKHVMASLWVIPDDTTSSFMNSFYTVLKEKGDPAKTLWNLQGTLLSKISKENEDALEEAILSYGGFVVR